MKPRASVLAGHRIELIMNGPGRRSWRRALGSLPQFQMAQNPFDNRGCIDQAYYLEATGAARAFQNVHREHTSQEPSPRIISGPGIWLSLLHFRF